MNARSMHPVHLAMWHRKHRMAWQDVLWKCLITALIVGAVGLWRDERRVLFYVFGPLFALILHTLYWTVRAALEWIANAGASTSYFLSTKHAGQNLAIVQRTAYTVSGGELVSVEDEWLQSQGMVRVPLWAYAFAKW
jgi:hypothetical protein